MRNLLISTALGALIMGGAQAQTIAREWIEAPPEGKWECGTSDTESAMQFSYDYVMCTLTNHDGKLSFVIYEVEDAIDIEFRLNSTDYICLSQLSNDRGYQVKYKIKNSDYFPEQKMFFIKSDKQPMEILPPAQPYGPNLFLEALDIINAEFIEFMVPSVCSKDKHVMIRFDMSNAPPEVSEIRQIIEQAIIGNRDEG